MRDINAQAVNFCFLDGYDSMENHGRSRRSMAFRSICFLLSLVLIAGIGYYVGEKLEESSVKEERSTMSSGFGRYEEKIYQGETYYKKTNVTTLLLMGVDRDTTQTSSSVSYRNGGQADFLMLLVIDHDDTGLLRIRIRSVTGVYRSAMAARTASSADDMFVNPGAVTCVYSPSWTAWCVVRANGRWL